MQKLLVLSLVGELRSHMQHGVAKKKKKHNKKTSHSCRVLKQMNLWFMHLCLS